MNSKKSEFTNKIKDDESCEFPSNNRDGGIGIISIDFHSFSGESEFTQKDYITNSLRISCPVKDLSLDPGGDVISNFIGHYGWWQFIWTFLLSLFQMTVTFHIFAFVFQTADKDFWCARPSNMTNMNVQMWKNLSQPKGSCSILDFTFSSNTERHFQQYLQLSQPFGNYWLKNDDDNHQKNMTMSPCKSFEFASDQMGMTIVEEFDLVCGRKNLLSVVEMCFLAGAAFGSVSSGWISDKFGRKHTLMSFATVQCVVGTILAFSTSLPMFMALRAINGFASMTVTVVSFVLVIELVSGKWRTIIGILNILPVALTYTITSGIAYLTRDWRLMQLIISSPWFALLLIWYCLPESPRWLLARGRTDELVKLIERASRMNGITLPLNYLKTLEAASPKPNQTDKGSTSPLLVLLSRKYRRTTILTVIAWFSMIILYFGLTLHLSNLGGNIYLNTAIAGLVEAASICMSIFVVLKLGIRRNLIAYMGIAGSACLLVNAVPNGNLWAVITLAMIGKCAMGATNAIIPTFTAQQYPTVVRNSGMGLGNLAAGIALILVPYMWLLEHYHVYLPMTIMGVMGLIGSGAIILMKDKSFED